ncbi:aminoglycoside phosphotransferase family protein [Paenibacillus piri]|uniref:Aminoglycoside phosphotransferase family protein n=1 Tax=Paenibacillus piri TaxID=2547395 RepID=A0A4R5KZ85_9BACL|nr:aminoglycoside phosphotransferase family protein [Paenibacillus piri]
MDVQAIREHIPLLNNIASVSKIHKGFSSDGKYFLFTNMGRPAYVLRTATLQKSEQKQREFEAVQRVHKIGVNTSAPVQFGIVEPLDMCYMLLRYAEGEDASDIVPALTSNEQYEIGSKAGSELRLMHGLEAPANWGAWHLRRIAKHKKQFEDYMSCGIRLPEETVIVSFIEANLAWMNDRPNRFQHDDFHPGNLLVHHRQYAGVIDFNRYDWGDPYHDFLKIAFFSRQVSIPFSIGQIDEYFKGSVPVHFWNLYALYTAFTIFSTISWTLQAAPEQLESMLARIRIVLDDHHNFERAIPRWYQN